MNDIFASLMLFAFGVFVLSRIWILESCSGGLFGYFASFYFSIQHIVFGLGGLLIILFDNGYYYNNSNGLFPYAEGIILLEVLNLIGILIGLLGVYTANIIFSSSINIINNKCKFSANTVMKDISMKNNSIIKKVCYLSLIFHAIIIGLQWYNVYGYISDSNRYIVQVFAQVAPATFLFWGLWWERAKGAKVVFVIYMILYGTSQMVSGGRGTFLYAILIFFAGLFVTSRKWLFRLHRLAVIALIIIIVPIIVVVSEDGRLYYSSREPGNVSEWIERVSFLLNNISLSYGGDDNIESINAVLFRFSSRICEVSALDVVARTPEEIHRWGWSDDDWAVLETGWLPAFLLENYRTGEHSGVLFLRDYGWEVDPEGGHSMPVTLLSDSWRRYGWVGVIGFHFMWGLILYSASMLIEKIKLKSHNVIISGALLYVITFSYTSDILTLFVTFPKRLMAVIFYAALITGINNLLKCNIRIGVHKCC